VLAGITGAGCDVVELGTRALTEVGFGFGDLADGELEILFVVLRRVRLGAGDVAGAAALTEELGVPAER